MLDDYPAAGDWLTQFPIVQREVGRQLLRTLRLVSHSEFERDLDVVLEQLASELGSENIALLSVSETVALRRLKYNKGKALRKAGSSADRVRDYAENFSRVHLPRVKAHPTIESMRAERIRNVVLIEDFVGTGRRISTYLKDVMHTSLKSWISYGWTKLWIVAYGGSTEGLRAIQRCGFGLSDRRIRLVTPALRPREALTAPMVMFCNEYARRTIRHSNPLGFGSAISLVWTRRQNACDACSQPRFVTPAQCEPERRFSNTQVGSDSLGKFFTLLLFSMGYKTVDLIRSARKRLVLIVQPLQFHDSLSLLNDGRLPTLHRHRLFWRSNSDF